MWTIIGEKLHDKHDSRDSQKKKKEHDSRTAQEILRGTQHLSIEKFFKDSNWTRNPSTQRKNEGVFSERIMLVLHIQTGEKLHDKHDSRTPQKILRGT